MQLAGTLAQLPAPFMNGVALNYLVMRVVFNYFYLTIRKGDKAALRTLVFQIMYLPLLWVIVRR